MKITYFCLAFLCSIQLYAQKQERLPEEAVTEPKEDVKTAETIGGCICNDKSIQKPDCDVCNVLEKNKDDTGVDCMCKNKIKLKEVPCADVCAKNDGWSGEFDS